MRQERIFLLLVSIVFILTILLITGVGYAAETENLIKISEKPSILYEQSDFKIVFSGESEYKGNGVADLKITGDRTATINITELKAVGDSVTVIFTIENKSRYLSANIRTEVTNTNTEYFRVSSRLAKSTINPQNGKVALEIEVELIKRPIYKDEKSYISINIFAYPNN